MAQTRKVRVEFEVTRENNAVPYIRPIQGTKLQSLFVEVHSGDKWSIMGHVGALSGFLSTKPSEQFSRNKKTVYDTMMSHPDDRLVITVAVPPGYNVAVEPDHLQRFNIQNQPDAAAWTIVDVSWPTSAPTYEVTPSKLVDDPGLPDIFKQTGGL